MRVLWRFDRSTLFDGNGNSSHWEALLLSWQNDRWFDFLFQFRDAVVFFVADAMVIFEDYAAWLMCQIDAVIKVAVSAI